MNATAESYDECEEESFDACVGFPSHVFAPNTPSVVAAPLQTHFPIDDIELAPFLDQDEVETEIICKNELNGNRRGRRRKLGGIE